MVLERGSHCESSLAEPISDKKRFQLNARLSSYVARLNEERDHYRAMASSERLFSRRRAG
jgi:hypothetical protein